MKLASSIVCITLFAAASIALAGPPVTASSVHPGNYKARLAFDGNPKTRWASRIDGKQWLQIDFGKSTVVDRVHINWERAHAVE